MTNPAEFVMCFLLLVALVFASYTMGRESGERGAYRAGRQYQAAIDATDCKEWQTKRQWVPN